MYNISSGRSSFLIKLMECCLVAFAAINIYNSLIIALISVWFGEGAKILNYMRLFGMVLVISCVIFGLAYPILWHLKEKRGKATSTYRHVFFLAIIRLWLAVMICIYAFAKILGTQFSSNLVRSNSLIKDLSGFDLTWFYFAYSYPFSVIIALFQLTGAIFLLFRKTIFLGVCILLPVMLNIVLINIFFKISGSAEINAIALSIGLLFLLSLFWQQIKDLIIKTSQVLPNYNRNNFANHGFRIVGVSFAFMLIYYLSITKSPAPFIGKWNVSTLIKGSDTLQPNAWLTDTSAWKNIYLGKFGDLTLNPNPYVIETQRAQKGKFHYESKSHTLSILFGKQNNVKNLLEFNVTETDKNHMKWIGEYQGQRLEIDLLKED
jgi:hypothetical protein